MNCSLTWLSVYLSLFPLLLINWASLFQCVRAEKLQVWALFFLLREAERSPCLRDNSFILLGAVGSGIWRDLGRETRLNSLFIVVLKPRLQQSTVAAINLWPMSLPVASTVREGGSVSPGRVSSLEGVPFYSWEQASRARIAAAAPNAKNKLLF